MQWYGHAHLFTDGSAAERYIINTKKINRRKEEVEEMKGKFLYRKERIKKNRR